MIAPLSKEHRVPTDEEFRKVGYTGEAAAYPLNEAQQKWLADFNGVDVSEMPDAWRYAPNKAVLKDYDRRLRMKS